MKRIISLFMFLLLIVFGMGTVSAIEIDEIYTGEQVSYNPETNIWARVKRVPTVIKKVENVQEDIEDEAFEEPEIDPSIILKRKTLSGPGSYSLYYYEKNKLAVTLHSNFEFVYKDRLIGVDNVNLKYYELKYYGDEFIEEPLQDSELSEIFDNAQIVKISEFENGHYNTTKNFFSIKKILLVNDTDRNFFKYSYKPPKVQQTEVKGYIRSLRYGKVVFSHYGEKEGALTINISKN